MSCGWELMFKSKLSIYLILAGLIGRRRIRTHLGVESQDISFSALITVML
jgi:hypothetical protein